MAGVLLVQLAFALAVGGDHFPGYRFAAPLWPLLGVAMARALWRGPGGSRLALASALAAVFAGAILLASPRVLLPLAEGVATLQRLERPPAAHTARLLLEIRHLGMVLLGVALWIGWGRAKRGTEPGPAAVLLLAACLVAAAALDPRIRAAREPDAASRYGRPVGAWLAGHLPPGCRRALHAAHGRHYVGYAGEYPRRCRVEIRRIAEEWHHR